MIMMWGTQQHRCADRPFGDCGDDMAVGCVTAVQGGTGVVGKYSRGGDIGRDCRINIGGRILRSWTDIMYNSSEPGVLGGR